MDRQAFWDLVEPLRDRTENDLDRYKEVLEAQLRPLSPEDLESFDRHLDQAVDAAYDWKLWAAAYLINGGCSDDGFYYFRGWLVVQGKDIYTRALADPDSLAEVCSVPNEDAECEEVLYVARQLYQEKTGRELDPPSLHGESHPEGPTGEEWEEDDLPELLPRLAAIHWQE